MNDASIMQQIWHWILVVAVIVVCISPFALIVYAIRVNSVGLTLLGGVLVLSLAVGIYMLLNAMNTDI